MSLHKACWQLKISRSPQGQKPKSSTSEVLGAAVKNLGTESIFFGAPGAAFLHKNLDHLPQF